MVRFQSGAGLGAGGYAAFALTLFVVGCCASIPVTAEAVSGGASWDPMATALGFQAADFLIPLDRVTEKLRSVPRGSILGQNSKPFRCGSTGADQIRETDEAWLITLDTAGYSTDELGIHIKRNDLRVHGEHKCADPTLCVKRRFHREYDLSATSLDLDKLSSRRTSDGVLEVRLPKAKDRQVDITVEDSPVVPPPEDVGSEPVRSKPANPEPKSTEPVESESTDPAQTPPAEESVPEVGNEAGAV